MEGSAPASHEWGFQKVRSRYTYEPPLKLCGRFIGRIGRIEVIKVGSEVRVPRRHSVCVVRPMPVVPVAGWEHECCMLEKDGNVRGVESAKYGG